jgi:hypothetical protein
MCRIKLFFFLMFSICLLLPVYSNGQKEKIGDEKKEQEVNMEQDQQKTDLSAGEVWTEILGTGFEIGACVRFKKDIAVIREWGTLGGIGWDAVPGNRVYYCRFFYKGRGEESISYVLVPQQNLFSKDDPVNKEVITTEFFITATPYLLLFGPLSGKDDRGASAISLDIEEVVRYTANVDENNKEIEGLESQVPFSLQIMRLEIHPYYVIMDAAEPGSSVPDDRELLKITGKKMIRFALIPDKGPIIKRWISPQPEEEPSHEKAIRQFLKDELDGLLESYKKGTIDITDDDTRLKTYEHLVEKLKALQLDEVVYKEWIKEILRLLSLSQHYGYSYGFDYGEMFSDYEPKTTPDTVLDFRPMLYERIMGLPRAVLENFIELLSLHQECIQKAAKNPGTWEPGNIILGANEKEYNPSDDELILAEIGSRLKALVEGTETLALKTYCKQNRITITSIEIIEIHFTHADVMGSGRFFYASEPVKQVLHFFEQGENNG